MKNESKLVSRVRKKVSLAITTTFKRFTLFKRASLRISVPLIVGILFTCLTPDMAIPELCVTLTRQAPVVDTTSRLLQ